MSSVYWDSSALLLALSDEVLRDRISSETAVNRVHSFAEPFSTLTGGRLGFGVSCRDASNQIRELASELKLISLDPGVVLNAMDHAERRGVRGGRVHDYLHAIAARESQAKAILTADKNDFKGLVDGIAVETLSAA